METKFSVVILVKEDLRNIHKVIIDSTRETLFKHINDQIDYLVNVYDLNNVHLEIGITKYRNPDLKDILCYTPCNSINNASDNESDTISLSTEETL
jgi:hypothetical protein